MTIETTTITTIMATTTEERITEETKTTARKISGDHASSGSSRGSVGKRAGASFHTQHGDRRNQGGREDKRNGGRETEREITSHPLHRFILR